MSRKVLYEINNVLTNISNALISERSTVFLINEENNSLDSLIAQGIRNNLISMPLDCGIAGFVASTGQPQIINDVHKSEHFNAYYDSITGFHTHKVLCTPILSGTKEVIGVIQSLNKQTGDFDKQDLKVLDTFAEIISIAVKNSNLYSSAESIKKDITTLLKVSSSINSELDLSNLIKLIIQKTSEITSSDRSTFFLLDKSENVLWTKFGEGLGGKVIKTRKGLASYVARTQKPIIENNPYQNPHFDRSVDIETGYRTKSIISVPVFDSTQTLIGVIQSINKKKDQFGEKDLFILNGFASQISIAIQNSTLFEEISNIKNYLNILFENLNNGILTINSEGRIKTVNKRFCDILGTDPEMLIGKHYKNLDYKYFAFLDYCDYTFRSGEKLEKHNLESLDTADRKLVLNYTALPMKDKDGANVGVINVINDITSEERMRDNLSRYLPQHVINEIVNKEDLSLFNGKYTESTILFSDIRNFTTLTEQLKAIDTVNFLNHYFDVMVECIFRHNGILDKFIGDAIMATFGIPYNTEKDAVNALHSAIDMINSLEMASNRQILPCQLNIGIGIATGQVISGNIGSEKRFEYTVVGDSVNLAARLEGLTKCYGVQILLCEETYLKIKHDFICREIDSIKARGKRRVVNIYTVMRKNSHQPSKEERLFISYYDDGLNFYRLQNFEQAIHCFNKALQIKPLDHPSKIMKSRCQEFRLSPPHKEWSGVWAFTASSLC